MCTESCDINNLSTPFSLPLAPLYSMYTKLEWIVQRKNKQQQMKQTNIHFKLSWWSLFEIQSLRFRVIHSSIFFKLLLSSFCLFLYSHSHHHHHHFKLVADSWQRNKQNGRRLCRYCSVLFVHRPTTDVREERAKTRERERERTKNTILHVTVETCLFVVCQQPNKSKCVYES